MANLELEFGEQLSPGPFSLDLGDSLKVCKQKKTKLISENSWKWEVST